jgi:YD repeat-containing protein
MSAGAAIGTATGTSAELLALMRVTRHDNTALVREERRYLGTVTPQATAPPPLTPRTARLTTYDDARRFYATDNAEGETVYYEYDEAGNRIMMQDPTGVTYWAYDALDRSFRQEGIP